jgi:thiol-disulfide isomerase/thioredoxin
MTELTIPANERFSEVAEPYDLSQDAHAALNAAFDRARIAKTRVLVKFGAAWCPDCRILAGMMAVPAIASFLDQHYEAVAIHIGRYDANMDLPERVGLKDGLEGVPALVIMKPDGSVVNPTRIFEWRTARSRTLQDLADYLTAFSG